MQKITPFLWFNDEAEEAVNFYLSVFPQAQVGTTTRYGKGVPGREGQVLTLTFTINGQEFIALNGGPQFRFTEAVSFVVACDTQEELDRTWEQLSEGGEKGRCGWLKDKWGLSWQVVPYNMGELMQSSDPAKSARVMQALMQMNKIDIRRLEEA